MTKDDFVRRIPEEMQGLKQWVLYKKVPKENGKTDKLPVNAATGELAKSNDPETWTDFNTVLEQSKKLKLGIGFMFAGGYVGVDIDGCRNQDSGELTAQAQDVAKELQSFTEISPSGTGIHIMCKGKLPPSGRRSGSLEMYDSGRFFTMTGNVLADYPKTVEDRTEQLKTVHAKYIQKPEKLQEAPKSMKQFSDNSDIWQKALDSKNGYKLRALFEGNWTGMHPSQSEADAALCQMLSFWYSGDSREIDNRFRQSGLMRPKWDEKHYSDGTTYGQKTISEALRTCKEFFVPAGEYNTKKQDKSAAELDICFMDTVKVKSVDWLPGWKPQFPLGKVVLLEGDPGIGKTTIMCSISAELTKQGYTVVFQSAEDSLEDTIVPRMLAAGADLSKLCCIREPINTLTFTDERIEKLFQKVRPTLATFDPIQAFLGDGIDMHRANQIRPIMQRLLILADKYNCSIVLCMHLNKSGGGKALYRGLGSIDIAAASRSVLLAGVDPNNSTIGALIHVKSSLAPKAKPKGFAMDEAGFRWTGDTELTEDRVLNGIKDESMSKTKQAEEFLKEKLSSGSKIDSAELQEEAEKIGIKKSTLWDAKKKLNVQAKKEGFKGKWLWFLNPEDLDEDKLLIRTQYGFGSSKEKTPSNSVESSGITKNRTSDSSSNSSQHEEPEQFFGESTENAGLEQRITNSTLLIHSNDCDEEDLPEWVKEAEKLDS